MTHPIHSREPQHRPAEFDTPTLPKIKNKQTGTNNKERLLVAGTNGGNGLRNIATLSGVATTGSAGATAAATGPLLTLGTSAYSIHLAHREGKELNDALKNDVAHHVTLRLASRALPDGYCHEATRQRLDGYHADDGARELLARTSDRVMTAVITEAGGLAQAQRLYEGNASDGMEFAMVRELRSAGDIEAYRQSNPAFRQRYDTDMAFHHGVKAGVWFNQAPPELRRRSLDAAAP
jgi:hypothetical protein